MTRLTPIDPPYSPEIHDHLMKWMPPGVKIEPLKLFRVFAHNPELMSRMRPLGAAILGKTSLIAPAEREIVIARVCARCGCEYEWGVHVASFGSQLDIDPAKFANTVTGNAADPIWSPREALLIQLVDDLHENSQVSDALWSQLAAEWETPQLLELIVMVGWYHLIAFVANVSGIRPEEWAARFP